MKIKKFLILILLILMLFILTGCSGKSNNIENFYYVIAIGIDKGENDLIKLNIQVATSSSDSSSDSAQSSNSDIYTVECPTITSGISAFDNYLSKKLRFSHCSAVIFSEEIAKEGGVANNEEGQKQ